MAKLAGGTVLAQAFGILAIPVLARLYGPDAFGAAAVFASITGIVGVIVCLRYELAILLPKDDGEAANVLGISLVGTVVMTLVCTGIVLVGQGSIARRLGAPELAAYLWLIPPVVLMGGVFQALNYWNTRTKMYGRLATVRAVQSALTNGVQIGLGAVGVTCAGGLIWGIVFGAVVATVLLSCQIWHDDGRLFRASLQWRAVTECMKRYRKFPLLDVWGSLLNVVSQQLPVLLLGVYFSQAIVGHYSLACRLIYLPMTFIGGAIGQVFFQRAADLHSKGEALAELVSDVFTRLARFTLLPALLLTIVGQEGFVLVFGPDWAEAGRYVEILGIWMFVWFISAPLTVLFIVLQRLELAFLMHSLLLVSRVVPLVIGGGYGDVRFALELYAVSGVVVYGGVAVWSMALAGVAWRAPLAHVGRLGVRAAPVALVVLLLDIGTKAPDWMVLLVATLGLLEHGWYVLREDVGLAAMLERFKHFKKPA